MPTAYMDLVVFTCSRYGVYFPVTDGTNELAQSNPTIHSNVCAPYFAA